MPRIELLRMTPDVLADIANDRMPANPGELAQLVKDVAVETERFRASKSLPFEWAGHLAIDGDRRLIIGTCAFKGAPDESNDHSVEIAYFTFPLHEGKGYATAMARALVELARANGARLVFAYTAAEHTASTSVLKKLGFEFVSPVQHPEDGFIWRWELPLDGPA
jgi:RimJ/RimL family protein N-acetyltransferase